MKRFLLTAGVLTLALLFAPQETRAEGFTGDFSIIGGEITEETPAAPVEPEKPAPVEPEKPAPVEPEKPAPVEPEKPAPVEPETPAPVEPETPSPVEPEKPAPVEPETPSPVEPETPSPVEPETPAAPSTEQETPSAPSTEQETPSAPSTEQETLSAPSTEQVVPSAQVEEAPLGEVVTIEDEPTPGQGFLPVSDSSNEGKASDTGCFASVIAWMALASMIIFFLLKRIYTVEQEKDGEYTVTKKFFRLSKAAEFLKEQNVSRIQIRNTWRRDDVCIVYKFEDGAESSEFATQKEAKILKKELGYAVPEEVLL